MSELRAFFAILRWDLAVELRRREATVNMCLFAVLVLFIVSYACSLDEAVAPRAGPIFYWVAIVFAGTVGLSRAFLVEKEGGALQGVLAAPLEPGTFYLAKVAATWIYVLAMAALLTAAYVVLFDFRRWDRLDELAALSAAFSLAYVAAGVLLAAMTTGLRGGEVVLRILIFPLMVPAIVTVLGANPRTFAQIDANVEATALSPWRAVAALGALAVIYLCACYLLFPKVVEE